MRFLLRMAFWLGVVLVLLPSGGSQPAPKVEVSAGEAISAAKAAVADMRQFCERQREACAVGSQAAVALGQRAQAGAKMLYEFLNEQLGRTRPGSTPSVAGKAVPLPTRQAVAEHTRRAGRSPGLARLRNSDRGAADRPKRRRGVKSRTLAPAGPSRQRRNRRYIAVVYLALCESMTARRTP